MASAMAEAKKSNPQHRRPVIFPRRLALCPERGLQRPPRKKRPVAGLMPQDEPLAVGGKDHVVFADDVAAAQHGKASSVTPRPSAAA